MWKSIAVPDIIENADEEGKEFLKPSEQNEEENGKNTERWKLSIWKLFLCVKYQFFPSLAWWYVCETGAFMIWFFSSFFRCCRFWFMLHCEQKAVFDFHTSVYINNYFKKFPYSLSSSWFSSFFPLHFSAHHISFHCTWMARSVAAHQTKR